MKIKLKSTLYFDFCFVSKLIWSIYRNSHWNKTSTQTFHKITFNTIILARRTIKFLDLNFLYKEKISVQKLYNSANQNNSVINSYFEYTEHDYLLPTHLLSNSFAINSVAITFICYQASFAIQPQLLSTHLLSGQFAINPQLQSTILLSIIICYQIFALLSIITWNSFF